MKAVPASAPVAVAPPLRRRLLFSIVLLLLVLVVPLGLLEFGLRLGGYGYETDFLLPRTVNGRPVWTDNPKFAHRFFPARIARSPQTLQVEVEKPADTVRVVVLGESAALGDPEPAFGLARQLDALLNAQFPGRRFEVINVAMTAINSHAFPDIARSAVKLRADYWVIYAGNNEFMGPFGPASIGSSAGRSRWLIRMGLALQTTRTGQWLADLAGRFASREAGESSEFLGLETFMSHRLAPDDPQLPSVYENFRANLVEVLDVARDAGVTTLLATPAVNLRDSGPFGSVVTPKDDDIRWLVTRAATNWTDAVSSELETLSSALPQQAALHFLLARARQARGDTNGAQADFLAARDLDALKFRADSKLADTVRQLGRERTGEKVVLLDAASAFATNVPAGVPGAEAFWEHVHFNFEGNFRLATLVADSLASQLGGQGLSVNRDAVAAALAFTEWNRARVVDLIRARIQRPPFTERPNSFEQLQFLAAETLRLRPAVELASFERHASIYRAALSKRTNDWMLRDQYAKLLTFFGDNDTAVEQWRQVVAQVPHHLMAHYQLGNALSGKAETAGEAEQHLRTALELREDFPEAWDRLGQTLGQQKKFTESERAFARALELRPAFTLARVNLALTRAAAGQTNEALAILRDATKRDTNNPAAWQNLNQLLTSAGQLPAAAEAAEEVVRLRPKMFAAHIQAAEAWQRASNPDRAGAHWLEAVKLNPDHVQARYYLALELAREKQFAVAVEQFREVVKRQPDLAPAHLNLGVALMALNQFEEAIVAFDRATALNPADPKAREYVRGARELLRKRQAGKP